MDTIREAAKRQRSISDMLIRDLTPIGPEWESENRLDIIKARQQTAAARALLLELQMVQEEPDSAMEGHRCTSDCRRIGCEDVEAQQRRAETLTDSDFVNYDVERMKDAEEDFGEGDGE
jgi:hypothetical protein